MREAMIQTPPIKGCTPKRARIASRCFIPFSAGRIIVSGPTAGARSLSAASSENALTVRRITS
jgi:hypothetical protein